MIMAVAFGVAIFGGLMLGIFNVDAVRLTSDEFDVEYGNQISTNINDYIKSDANVEKNAKLYLNVPDQPGYNYPAVGIYTGIITYDKKAVSFRVKVVDTTVPVFKNFSSSITVPVGTSIKELASYFSATDLSDVTINISSDTLDLNTAGTYSVVVAASDSNGNTASKNCVVTVKDDSDNNSQNNEDNNNNTDNNDNNSNTDTTPTSGLADSGYYTDGNGNNVSYESYYSQDEADALAAEKEADTTLTVVNYATIFENHTVYRVEWYTTPTNNNNTNTDNTDNNNNTNNTDNTNTDNTNTNQ